MKRVALEILQNEMLVGGESVIKFEQEFAKYIGTDYAVSTNSGSSALLLAFNAINTKNDDKVVTPSATFIATINGACALELQHQTGSIAKGKKADLIITKPIPSVAYLPYSFSSNQVDKTIIKGDLHYI